MSSKRTHGLRSARGTVAAALSPKLIGSFTPSMTQASPCSSRSMRGTRSRNRSGTRSTHNPGGSLMCESLSISRYSPIPARLLSDDESEQLEQDAGGRAPDRVADDVEEVHGTLVVEEVPQLLAERDLAAVVAEVLGPACEQHPRLAVLFEERHQDRRRATRVGLVRDGFGRRRRAHGPKHPIEVDASLGRTQPTPRRCGAVTPVLRA